MTDDHKEIMELSHEPVPGYRGAFYISITVGSLYLGLILYLDVGFSYPGPAAGAMGEAARLLKGNMSWG